MEATSGLNSVDEISEHIAVQDAPSKTGISPTQPVTRNMEAEDSEIAIQNIKETAEGIAKKMNEVATVFNTSLAFSVDKPTGKTVIKVMDKATDEVIRQIPPEEALRLIGKLRDVMGMLLDVEF